jgi:uncharacterized protein (DUF169 family)
VIDRNSRLVEKLKFKLEPVAIYFTDEKPEDALQFEEGKRGCIVEVLDFALGMHS